MGRRDTCGPLPTRAPTSLSECCGSSLEGVAGGRRGQSNQVERPVRSRGITHVTTRRELRKCEERIECHTETARKRTYPPETLFCGERNRGRKLVRLGVHEPNRYGTLSGMLCYVDALLVEDEAFASLLLSFAECTATCAHRTQRSIMYVLSDSSPTQPLESRVLEVKTSSVA
eukprot:6375322-Pyramimonas_sp.AAC.1